MELAIIDGAARVPAFEDRGHRAPELIHRVVGERLPGLALDDLLERRGRVAQHFPGKVDVPGDARGLLALLQGLLEDPLVHVEHHAAVHLHEPAIGVVREARVAAHQPEAFDRRVVEPQVENRLHHARHGQGRTGADRHEQRLPATAELATGRGLEPPEGGFELRLEPRRKAVGLEIGVAETRGDREPRRYRDAEVGHFRESRPLPAQHVLHGRSAVGATLSEEVDQGPGRGIAHPGVPAKGGHPGLASRPRRRGSDTPRKSTRGRIDSWCRRPAACRRATGSRASRRRGSRGSPRPNARRR